MTSVEKKLAVAQHEARMAVERRRNAQRIVQRASSRVDVYRAAGITL